jgi:DtxR family transcriptional regulator, Mn-dependent transcriptional regulator
MSDQAAVTRATMADVPPEPARPSETVDRYLEAIYHIAHEGEKVRPSRLAEWLGVTAPTVSVNLQRFERDGWLTIARNRSVSLTVQGEAAAARVVRRHRLLERWMTDVLGFDWAIADAEAGRLGHYMSDLVVERLDVHLERPVTCPHGNTIPGRPEPERALVSLADLEPDAPARVIRISEVAEHDAPDLLSFLSIHHLVPGARVTVTGDAASPGTLHVDVAGQGVSLETSRARAVWVEVVGAIDFRRT